MVTLTQRSLMPRVINPRLINPRIALWMATVGVLAALLALLTKAIIDNPTPSQDIALMNWVAGWHLAGLVTFFGGLSALTSSYAGLVYGPVGIAALLIMHKLRAAIAFGLVGVTVAVVSILGDYTLGELVDRGRPLAGSDFSTPSFPSGHVFGSTVFFGFIGFLGVYYRLEKKYLIPLLAFVVGIITLVGPARVYDQAHFPSDVAAGYLLAALWLLVIIPAFLFFRGASWVSSGRSRQDLSVEACGENCRVERSIASVVVLDPVHGTATKVYRPPFLVRLLYWLAFQAKFPYEGNLAALRAGKYRRQIASLLTIHRFGKDLVSPVTALDCEHGRYSFVTEFVPGEKVGNDQEAKRFLAQVTETFAEAGLGVWQVNPHNPHAHTNLIRTPEGDFKIIDLESAVVTLLPARGQFRSALKSGNFPIFDDIAFPRLREYISANQVGLEASLGPGGLAGLKHATDQAEQTISAWKDAEPRIWGHIISRIYKLLNWKECFQHMTGALAGAQGAGEAFLRDGISRWEKEGRINPQEVEDLRTRLASGAAPMAMRHMGAQLVLSVAIAVPIPGLRSLARFLWTLAFWAKAQARRLRRGGGAKGEEGSNIHTPLVMVLSILPAFGAVAYLAARPLRNKLLIRLMLDQMAWKLPFKLYYRMRLGKWLAKAPAKSNVRGDSMTPAKSGAR